MAGFRENRITIIDLFPSISAWSKRQDKTKQSSVCYFACSSNAGLAYSYITFIIYRIIQEDLLSCRSLIKIRFVKKLVQHHERIKTPRGLAHLNQNLNDVSKSQECIIRNYILLTINMSEKPTIGLKKNKFMYRILWNDQITQRGRKYSLISIIFAACL